MKEYINWLIGHLYYKWVRLTGKPDEVFEENGWIYEIDYLNFGFFQQKHIHGRKKI